MYTAIFARRVRLKKGKKLIKDPAAIHQALKISKIEIEAFPDMMVLGHSNISLPAMASGSEHVIASPFCTLLHDQVAYADNQVNKIAFGVAIVHLLWALDSIILGPMPWYRIVADSLGMSTDPDKNS